MTILRIVHVPRTNFRSSFTQFEDQQCCRFITETVMSQLRCNIQIVDCYDLHDIVIMFLLKYINLLLSFLRHKKSPKRSQLQKVIKHRVIKRNNQHFCFDENLPFAKQANILRQRKILSRFTPHKALIMRLEFKIPLCKDVECCSITPNWKCSVDFFFFKLQTKDPFYYNFTVFFNVRINI